MQCRHIECHIKIPCPFATQAWKARVDAIHANKNTMLRHVQRVALLKGLAMPRCTCLKGFYKTHSTNYTICMSTRRHLLEGRMHAGWEECSWQHSGAHIC